LYICSSFSTSYFIKFIGLSVGLLNTQLACDGVIDALQAQKETVVFNKLSTERRLEVLQSRAQSANANLVASQATVDGLGVVINALPAGDLKDKYLSDKVTADYKLFVAQGRVSDNGFATVISVESLLEQYDAQITRIDALIGSVNTHKATL
jgi:hypothetical protein